MNEHFQVAVEEDPFDGTLEVTILGCEPWGEAQQLRLVARHCFPRPYTWLEVAQYVWRAMSVELDAARR